MHFSSYNLSDNKLEKNPIVSDFFGISTRVGDTLDFSGDELILECIRLPGKKMDTNAVLSDLKKTILAGNLDADHRKARNQLIEFGSKIMKGELPGDVLVGQLLYVYEAKFVREEDSILARYRDLQQRLLAHIGQHVMVVSSQSILVGPNDTGLLPPTQKMTGRYSVMQFGIQFGIISSSDFFVDEHSDQLMLDTGACHVQGVNRDGQSFKCIRKNLPLANLYWQDSPATVEIVVGQRDILTWFRSRVGRDENRLVGLYGYLTGLLSESAIHSLANRANEIRSLISERDAACKEYNQRIVKILHEGVPQGLNHADREVYDVMDYFTKYWPPNPRLDI